MATALDVRVDDPCDYPSHEGHLPKLTYLPLGASRKSTRPMSKWTIRKIPWFGTDPPKPPIPTKHEREPSPMPPWAVGAWDSEGVKRIPPPDDREAWLPRRVGNLIYAAWGLEGIRWAKEKIEEVV